MRENWRRFTATGEIGDYMAYKTAAEAADCPLVWESDENRFE